MDPQTPEKKPGFIKRNKKLVITILTFAVLAFGGNYYITQSTKKEPVSTSSIIDELAAETATDDGTGPVAKVNGTEISRVDFQNTVKELTLSLLQQGYNTNDATVISQIKQQAVAVLVNTELLIQDARAKGVVATDEEVSAEYQNILKDMGSQEVLMLTLQDMNITEEDLMQDIRNQIAVNKHVESATSINSQTVTDEEVKAYYDNVSTNNADLPSFDTIKEELKEEILQGKRQQVVSDFIQGLREAATIEELI